ncbi:MAG: hypothetical protein WAO98_09865 [Alphaproteobacteria bacterium]
MKPKTQLVAYAYSPEREKRVADALRENLRKRKQQKLKSAIKSDEIKE